MKDHMRLFSGLAVGVPSSVLGWSVMAALLVTLSAGPTAVHAAPDDVVLLWGNTTEGPEMVSVFGQAPGVLVHESAAAAQVCRQAQSFLYMNLAGPVSAALGALGSLGVEQPGLGDFPIPSCGDPDGTSGDAWFIFTGCSMIMGTGTHWMRWTVPPLTSEPEMVAIDLGTGEGVRARLESALEDVKEAEVPTGHLTNYTFDGPAGTRPDTLKISEGGAAFVDREFTSHYYDFSYEAKIGMFGGADSALMESGFMADLGTIKSKGHAWIVPDAPGADVIRLFYDNFRKYVSPPAGANSLIGGALRQMAGIASRGIPIETEQTSSMGMGAMSMLAQGSMKSESTSTSSIHRIMVLHGAASGACGPTVIPDGVEMTDLDEAMAAAQGAAAGSGAGSGAGPGVGSAPGMNSPEFQEAMQQASEAMQQMTPEQRQMMQQLGLGGMIPGAAAPGGGSSGGAAPGGGSSGSAIPSRQELYSDDMAQMVQKHLQALGYDPGNVDGDVTTDTIIAISEFQAEHGLKVTGEVSPQLAGVLSAEVDKRR